jgi:hypothetical protein
MEMVPTVRQLHARGPACRGLAVDLEGVVLGTDHVLVRRTSSGYQVADFGATEWLLKTVYGDRHDTRHLLMQLDGVRRALDDGDLVKAQILGLQTRLAGIRSDDLARLDAAATLLKYDPAQPRDDIGRWTTGNGAAGAGRDAQEREAFKPSEPYFPEAPVSSPSLAPAVAPAVEGIGPEVLALLGRLAVAVGGRALLGSAFALIPTNESNIHEGAIPGRPDLGYRSDEGILTIFHQDDQGNIQRVFEGFPDGAGLYRDGAGRVIGQRVGTGAVFNLDSLPLFGGPLDSPSSASQEALASSPDAAVSTEQAESCPPPTLELDNGKRSARAIAYQAQITGLLPGFDVQYNGLRFDGCDEITQRMLEAKGPGNDWLLERHEQSPFKENYYDKLMSQAENQNRASAGRGVDWHFADRGEALFYYLEFNAHHFDNIRVYYTEAVVKKTEDCVLWIKNALRGAESYLAIYAGNRPSHDVVQA